MSTTEQERWTRVKGRLRTEVGEDVYSSWFARMDLEGVISKRRSAPYRSGTQKDWVKVKSKAWREANQDRSELLQHG